MDNFEPLLDSKKESPIDKKIRQLSSKKDPFKSSCFLTKLLFGWAVKIIILAKNTSLKTEYLGELDPSNKIEAHIEKVEELWQQNKHLKDNALLKTVLKSNLCTIITIMMFMFTKVGLEFFSIFLLKTYIGIFVKRENGVETPYSPIIVGSILCTAKLCAFLIGRQVNYNQSFQGYKANSELNVMIYKKLLRLSPADNQFSSGEIINLISWDSAKFAMLMESCPDLILMPIQITAYNIMLFQLLGLAYSTAFGILLLTLTFLFVNFKKQRNNIRNVGLAKDARLKVTTELFNSLKVLKLYGWEECYMNKVNDERRNELAQCKERFAISNCNFITFFTTPMLLCVSTIGIINVLGQTMNLADILTAVTIFNTLQEPLSGFPWICNLTWDVLNSLARIERFLRLEDVIPDKIDRNNIDSLKKGISISVRNGNFYWKVLKKANSHVALPTDAAEKELKDVAPTIRNINIDFFQNELVGVIGEVGSGKSSFLESILNNLYSTEETKLIINGEVSYITQMPWIQNDSLRNNILFNKEYDELKYRQVLEMCELRKDIDALSGGDQIEIGDKGFSLSGGQKARIALARAVYYDSDIYLFDDVISCLDAHVGHRIMMNLIVKHLKDKTRLIVTNSLPCLQYMHRIIYMNNGEIAWMGSYEQLVKQDFFHQFAEKTEKAEKVEKNNFDKETEYERKEAEKIVVEEKKQTGSVKCGVYCTYINNSGGCCVFVVVILCVSLWQFLKNYNDMWLASWAKQSNLTEEENIWYFGIYAGIGMLNPIFFYLRLFLLTRNSLECSKQIHTNMIKAVVEAPINTFHDVVPKGVLLNRFAKDISTVDVLVYIIGTWIVNFVNLAGAIIMCSIFMYEAFFSFSLCFFAALLVTRFSMNGSRELERLDGTTRGPMLNILSESISGATSIRAYMKEDLFVKKFLARVNTFFKVRVFLHGVTCFFGISLDLISLGFLMFLLGMTVFLEESLSAKAIGLMLSYAILLERSLFKFLTATTNCENGMVAMERCVEYTKLGSERFMKTEKDALISEWKGKIQFEDFSVRYRTTTPLVLKNLNFTINAGEKVGIAGRTGSGKTTMCMSLFRIIEAASGKIFIDDVDISTLGLSLLRKRMTIIPQDPTLFVGSLRSNIDSLNLYTDEEILKVIKMIGFHMTDLNCIVKENGSNFSVGEKQLICFIRAILRKSKIIIMDEATANIDNKTEDLINHAIREMAPNSTFITIAHRINSIIDYDRILVIKNGEAIEYDTPEKLLRNKSSHFYELYSKSQL